MDPTLDQGFNPRRATVVKTVPPLLQPVHGRSGDASCLERQLWSCIGCSALPQNHRQIRLLHFTGRHRSSMTKFRCTQQARSQVTNPVNTPSARPKEPSQRARHALRCIGTLDRRSRTSLQARLPHAPQKRASAGGVAPQFAHTCATGSAVAPRNSRLSERAADVKQSSGAEHRDHDCENMTSSISPHPGVVISLSHRVRNAPVTGLCSVGAMPHSRADGAAWPAHVGGSSRRVRSVQPAAGGLPQGG